MKLLLQNLLKGINNWNQLKSAIASQNLENVIVGKIFEEFTKLYFLHEPSIKDDFVNVWLYNDIPPETKNKLGLGKVEHGVDLLLEDNENRFIAVQCKYRSDESIFLHWSSDKIANLFGYGLKADGYIVFSNVSGIDHVSITRNEHFTFYGISDLLAIQESTYQSIYEALIGNLEQKIFKYSPKEHQLTAINSAIEYYKSNTRGQLILPCGAGKTLTALWIKEKLNAKNTLVLVPSLALLRQIKNDWARQKSIPYHYISVCSEKDINSEEADSLVSHTYEVGGFVSTNPKEVFSFLKRDENKVVFSTYQSLPVIIESIKNSDFKFDLILCDEAHKTAGTKQGLFGLVHDNVKLPASKRLYMTATPRVVSDTLKQRANNDEEFLYDMNDANIFGEEIYRMSFKDAIDKGILVDYKIIAIGVSDLELKEFIKERRYAGSEEFIMEDWANNYALEIVMKKYNANHAITFHSRVKYAEQFSERHAQLFKEVDSFYVSGEQHTSKRAVILNQFKTSEKSIIANARCLTEGVDVPAIDLVYFCDPKNSKVDIVQASGRALRLDHSRNKQIGYIVVPVFHVNQEKVEDAIIESQFKNLISIIRSLCDQDERLQEEINYIAFGKGIKSKSSSHIQVSIELKQEEKIFLEGFEEKLKNSLFDQIIERTARLWDLQFMKFKEYLEINKDYPTKHTDYYLYAWMVNQRNSKKKGRLTFKQIENLDSIDFVWDSHEATWDENFDLLVKYLNENNNKYPSQENKEPLANWIMYIRAQYKENTLDEDRLNKLKSINFLFEPFEHQWEKSYRNTIDWLNKNKKFPTNSENNSIYNWLKKQSEKIANGTLEKSKIDSLEKIKFQEFIVSLKNQKTNEEIWEENFKNVEEFKKQNNKFPTYNRRKRETEITQSKLGNWLHTQKSQAKKLTDDQKKKLSDIGFDWNKKSKFKRDNWDKKFEELNKYFQQSKAWPTDASNKKLARWCNTQRSWYKGTTNNKSEYPKERKEKLDSIGFPWDVRDETWDDKFQKIKDYFEKNNTTQLPTSVNGKNNILYTWLVNQKVSFRRGKLENNKIEKLKEIGIDLENESIN